MKTGKITVKLRDAVPVCFMAEGKEVKRYKNIDLPDKLKEIEMPGFHFNVSEEGKITFEIPQLKKTHRKQNRKQRKSPDRRQRKPEAWKSATM